MESSEDFGAPVSSTSVDFAPPARAGARVAPPVRKCVFFGEFGGWVGWCGLVKVLGVRRWVVGLHRRFL